ncbi:MAG: TIGR04086 family membrane protein [Clostridia bacterium]|nr:TIGR04086 family membrane protein [Clostridia bacterium]
MRDETNYGKGFFGVLKGAGAALGFSFLASVLFAALLQGTAISDKVIYPVNQTLKVLAVLLGALLFVRGEKGWLQGCAIGLLFTALSYLAFSAIGGDFSLSWLIFAELLLAAFAGVVGGVIAVNIKR